MELIAGVDEAGRGPLAGPVVAAAVILPNNHKIEGLADSKKLTPKKREKLFDEIKAVSQVGIGIVSHKTIDRINILQGTFKAMRKALGRLSKKPEKALIDGFPLPDQVIKNEGIIGGDSKIESISAASIVAKVTRDQIMKNMDPIFPEFGFSQHKGYGTKQHMEALKKFKATPIHRKTFRPVKENMPNIRWLKSSKLIGKLGEQLVALKYLNDGFQIVKMNHICSHYGEINIITEKNDQLIFIEVKTATKDQKTVLDLKLDQSKLQKLKSAIPYYLSELGEEKDVRLDIASVMIGKNPIIKRYQGVRLD